MIRVIVLLVLTWLVHNYFGSMGYVANYGISFGWFGSDLKWVLVIMMMLALFVFRKEGWPIIVGGLINMSDRWRFGFVRDYWKIPFTSIYNNIADWLIFGGVLFILAGMIWKKYK